MKSSWLLGSLDRACNNRIDHRHRWGAQGIGHALNNCVQYRGCVGVTLPAAGLTAALSNALSGLFL
jgi:hypothetical protein